MKTTKVLFHILLTKQVMTSGEVKDILRENLFVTPIINIIIQLALVSLVSSSG